MNSSHSPNYYFKRVFSKGSTWLILLIHIAFASVVIYTFPPLRNTSTIDNTNDFFNSVFFYCIILPVFYGTFVISPISGLFWGQFDDIARKTQEDGTDLFFLSTEIPTSRKQVFWGKVAFLTSSLTGLHLIFFATPIALLLGKVNYFGNFTGGQTALFLACNFLIIPLLFFVPLVIFLFSLASLKSVWYTILKGLGRLSVIILLALLFLIYQRPGETPNKVAKLFDKTSNGLQKHCFLTTLTIMGAFIILSFFTLFLAYKKFQKEDLK